MTLAAISIGGAPVRALQQGRPQLFGHKEIPGQWVNIGPAPMVRSTGTDAFSGRVSSVAVDPTNPGHWLVGVGNGGVWETKDTGKTWTAIADDAPTLAIGAVTFAPSDANVIYVATGEAIYRGYAHTGVGILKSTDGARSWSLVGQSAFDRVAVKRLRVHPTNPNIVLAASSRGGGGRDANYDIRPHAPTGIWKSTDGGVTWLRKLGGEATAIEIDPANFNNQYAAIGDQSPGFAALDPPGSSPNGIYRSTDGGETWNLVAGPWGTSTLANNAVGRIELAIAPSNTSVLYAGIQRGGNNPQAGPLGLFRTDNAWTPTPTWLSVPLDQTTGSDYCGSGEAKCGYTHFLSVDPTDPNRVFAGGRFVWRCSNCGAAPTWANVNPGSADHHAAAWAGTRLIVGSDFGVFSTTTLGGPWQSHNTGLPTAMFYSGALHPADPNLIVGGFRDFGTVVQRNGSYTWRALGPGESAEGEVAVSSSHAATDWMMSRNTILRTMDGGQTSIVADSGIDWSGAQPFVQPVRKCPNDDNVFLAGTNRLWRTNNFFNSGAPSWSQNSPTIEAVGQVHSIAYAPSNSGCDSYAFGTQGGRVFLTQNAGSTWTDLDPRRNLPQRPITWLAYEPGNPTVLYATVSSYDEYPGSLRNGHVFKTMNAGSDSSWTNISPPSNVPFNVVAIDPRNPLRVYAGSDVGLWHSNDAGGTWIKDGLDVGLPNVSVYDIQINVVTNRTVIFTYGRGAYVLTPQ